MSIKVYSESTEVEMLNLIADGGYMVAPDTLSHDEIAKLVSLSDKNVLCIEYYFSAANTQLKCTKYLVTEYLFRTYETWRGLGVEDSSFYDMMKIASEMTPEEAGSDGEMSQEDLNSDAE